MCRVIPDRWKGMSPDQLEKIRETQTIQREERKVSNYIRAFCTATEHASEWGLELCFEH